MFDTIAATPSNNDDNSVLTYCTESYTHSYVICDVNPLVNRPGGVGTYTSRFGNVYTSMVFILLLSVVVIPSRSESYPRSTPKRIMSIQYVYRIMSILSIIEFNYDLNFDEI